jgi:DNA invertase Pin-like site-specific DNA recombinase
MDIFEIKNELSKGKSIYDLNLRVTYYARVSTDKYEQENSLQNQIGFYEDLIKNHDKWEYVKGYIDEGLSGKSVEKRTQFLKMIEDAKLKKFDLIITKEISRFSRNTVDSLNYTRELLRYGVGVYFQNDNINTLYTDAELRLAIMSSIAQDELRKLSERIKFGHKRSIENGRVLGNNKIWGYIKNNGKLEIVEEEAEIIRLIFKTYSEGKGIREVSKVLKENNMLNKKDKSFSFNTIKYIINNPKYKGFYRGNVVTTVDYMTSEKKHIKQKDWKLYEDNENCPPIIDENTWEICNKILRERSEKMKSDTPTSYQNKFKYSGKIYCGEHNESFWRTVFKYNNSIEKEVWQCRVYRHGGRKACSSPIIYTKEIDWILENQIRDIFINKDFSKNIDMLIRAKSNIKSVFNIDELETKIKQLEAKKDKLLDLSIDGKLSNADFKKQNDKLNIEIDEINLEIENHEKLNYKKQEYDLQLKKIKEVFDNKEILNLTSFLDIIDKILIYDLEDNTIKMSILLKIGLEIPYEYKIDKTLR